MSLPCCFQTRHKEEVSSIRSACSEAVSQLKVEMLSLIMQRAAAAEEGKREQEGVVVASRKKQQAEQASWHASLKPNGLNNLPSTPCSPPIRCESLTVTRWCAPLPDLYYS